MQPEVRQLIPFAVAIVATLLTSLVAMLLRPIFPSGVPLMVFFVPILVTCYFANVPAALFAAALSAVSGSYFSFNPVGSFYADELPEQVRLVVFLIISAGIAYFTARLTRTHRQLIASEAGTRQALADLERAQHHQQLLVRELKHRIGNMLAGIESIVRQTGHHSRSMEDFQESFSHRVRALAKVNNILTSANWTDAAVRELLLSEIALRTVGDGQALLEGPDIRLRPRAAMALHMAIHELCTNSAKYGALSTPLGKVRVAWSVEERMSHKEFRLLWEESNGPPVAPPRRQGFGSELLHKTVGYELGGVVELSFPRSGAICEFSFPWTEEMGQAPPAPPSRHAGRSSVPSAR